MRKRYLQDYKMFAGADNFESEVPMGDAGPSTEGGGEEGDGGEVNVET